MDWDKIKKELMKPFNISDIRWRIGSTNKEKTKGLALAYISNRAIQNRLDEVFGMNGWKNEFKEWKADNKQLCGISVWDDDKEEWITKWDGAEDTDFEETKGGLSNAMKRAAYQWGIGRYLYDVPSKWIEIEQQGRSYRMKGSPELPGWALPTNDITIPQLNTLKEIANSKNVDETVIARAYHKETLEQLTTDDFVKAMKRLSKTEAKL
ncbi:Rad52/Rad22 family DNA repair protein [Anaerophilus nitritogenes]|uniref:Rad52/Rad22 family DNA repair protein n=1 Tax=Anaerophilus nitritogenes TaxID=2498136 RepID=UPI00101C55BF|nr:Rad52/Rad22 family DNA repair protein [Anaerophilus nitritogenes]